MPIVQHLEYDDRDVEVVHASPPVIPEIGINGELETVVQVTFKEKAAEKTRQGNLRRKNGYYSLQREELSENGTDNSLVATRWV